MGRKPKNPIDPVTGKRRRGRPKKEWIKGEVPNSGAIVPRKDTEPLAEDTAEEEQTVAEISADLDKKEREQLAAILRKEFSVDVRAKLLMEIAQMTDTKRAPVALRALQEINELTGVKQQQSESTPLFVLPDGTDVLVGVKIPRK